MPIRNFKTDWIFPESIQVPGSFQAQIGGTSLVARTLYQRGYSTLEEAYAFLNPEYHTPAPPEQLPGLIPSADLLQNVIQNSQSILIWGDFDVDGQTSTTLLHSALSKLGARSSYYIPNRATESHGISLPALKSQIELNDPSLIITCDTGIDEFEAIAYARQLGIEVLVTDHHQLPDTLPDATAIINPNLLSSDHPLFHLPGVGVAYKLVEELYSRHDLASQNFLDLVALGIVADVAVQTKDTRYLLQLGLEILRDCPRTGLAALYELAGISPVEITEEQIGFVIGPRLNALGRLADANPSVEFLMTDDRDQAYELANYLESLNIQRQNLTEEIFSETMEVLSSDPYLVEEFPVIVLSGPSGWNPGVIGIVASRIVDRFHKPVIILSEDGSVSRGSARSIPGVPISKLIGQASDLLLSHGGHPMAAGLSLLSENISKFRTSLADSFYQVVGDFPDHVQIQIDAELTFQEIDLDLISDINRLAPFGAGNPKLLFASRGVMVRNDQTIGKKGTHRKLTLCDPSGSKLDVLWWNGADVFLPDPPLDIAYSLDQSTFRNQPQVQATLKHIRQSPESPVYIKKSALPRLVDLRAVSNPVQELNKLYSGRGGLIWAEVDYPPDYRSYRRFDLQRDPLLYIWTAPPSRQVLQSVVETVDPQEIFLFGIDTSFSTLEDFIQGILGLFLHSQRTDQSYDTGRFAQALGVPIDAIEIGVVWIQLQGNLDLESLNIPAEIDYHKSIQQLDFMKVDQLLKRSLHEIAAYRKHYLSAEPGTLL